VRKDRWEEWGRIAGSGEGLDHQLPEAVAATYALIARVAGLSAGGHASDSGWFLLVARTGESVVVAFCFSLQWSVQSAGGHQQKSDRQLCG
jgi:hypothetical protein